VSDITEPLVIERAALLSGLRAVLGIVKRDNSMKILDDVLLEAENGRLRLSTTDLDVHLRTEIPCAGGTGSLTLEARKLFEVAHESAGDQLTLKMLDNGRFELSCGSARFKMIGLDPRSFPAIPAPDPTATTLRIPAPMLADLIDLTLFVVSPNEARYTLRGVHLEAPRTGLARMVATDAHRLALCDREVQGLTLQGSAILPHKGLSELRKLLDACGENPVELTIDGQRAALHNGSTAISMGLVEGAFPDYLPMVPRERRGQAVLARDQLLRALERAALFADTTPRAVELAFTAGTLTVSATNPVAQVIEPVDVDLRGEELTVSLNPDHFLQGLRAVADGAIVPLELVDDTGPCVLTTESDPGFTYIVLPSGISS
jgi:DNA polymerase-3 subunit beta